MDPKVQRIRKSPRHPGFRPGDPYWEHGFRRVLGPWRGSSGHSPKPGGCDVATLGGRETAACRAAAVVRAITAIFGHADVVTDDELQGYARAGAAAFLRAYPARDAALGRSGPDDQPVRGVADSAALSYAMGSGASAPRRGRGRGRLWAVSRRLCRQRRRLDAQHLGRVGSHQFHRPRRVHQRGTSSARTTVASIRMPDAQAVPSTLMSVPGRRGQGREREEQDERRRRDQPRRFGRGRR